tara:strand:- start:1910 stop:2998 length:1089 start_codon:yes stop_codon:yes gene_type:complete
MKKILLLLIIPFLSFGQIAIPECGCGDPNLVDPDLPCPEIINLVVGSCDGIIYDNSCFAFAAGNISYSEDLSLVGEFIPFDSLPSGNSNPLYNDWWCEDGWFGECFENDVFYLDACTTLDCLPNVGYTWQECYELVAKQSKGWCVGYWSDPIEILDCDSTSCALANGELVPNGWEGSGIGENFCNSCLCDNGVLICTEMSCTGCTSFYACNYNPDVSEDDGSCDYSCFLGCLDEEASNYCETCIIDDGSCEYNSLGCTNPDACNYDLNATEDDGSCDYSCLCESDTVLILDTIVVVEYVVDTLEFIITEYIDCSTGMPCGAAMEELLDKSKINGKIYNLLGQEINRREGIYIEGGEVRYRLH